MAGPAAHLTGWPLATQCRPAPASRDGPGAREFEREYREAGPRFDRERSEALESLSIAQIATPASRSPPMNFIQRFARNTTARVGIAGSLLTFFWRRKLWWMTPLVAVLLVLGILVIFGQSSAISAFIYTIF